MRQAKWGSILKQEQRQAGRAGLKLIELLRTMPHKWERVYCAPEDRDFPTETLPKWASINVLQSGTIRFNTEKRELWEGDYTHSDNCKCQSVIERTITEDESLSSFEEMCRKLARGDHS